MPAAASRRAMAGLSVNRISLNRIIDRIVFVLHSVVIALYEGFQPSLHIFGRHLAREVALVLNVVEGVYAAHLALVEAYQIAVGDRLKHVVVVIDRKGRGPRIR